MTDRDGHKKKMNHKNPNKEQPRQTNRSCDPPLHVCTCKKFPNVLLGSKMDLLLYFVTLNGQMPFYLNFSGNLIIIHIFAACFSEAFSGP